MFALALRRGGVSAVRRVLLGLVLAGGWLVAVPSVAQAETVTFDYTGAAQTWVVPAGVTSASFTVHGAQGGAYYEDDPRIGLGGRATGTITVTPGESLQINVGGAGGADSYITAGGFNGGGDSCQFGGSGGGASDVRRGSFALADRLIVAGGGGGTAYGAYPPDKGGDGGGVVGQDGSPTGLGGGGGTQTEGGAGGNGNHLAGNPGALGTGGSTSYDDVCGVGGGGGGLYGGGSGGLTVVSNTQEVGGGGGGSGYTSDPSGVLSQGVKRGNGEITITFTAEQEETVTFDYTGAAQTWVVPAGVTSASFTVHGAQGGAYYADDPRIGLGGRATGTITVTPGESLQINVGGAGGADSYITAGGFNGGGDSCQFGGSGGGASDVRRGSFALADRLIVAGGGGGTAYGAYPPDKGGDGGGVVGQDGSPTGLGGGGGTQTEGGAGGNGNHLAGNPGALGTGGSTSYDDVCGVGGGGGGLYGGGSGGLTVVSNMQEVGGGGGGSGYTSDPSGVLSQGVKRGNGKITITFTAAVDEPTVRRVGCDHHRNCRR